MYHLHSTQSVQGTYKQTRDMIPPLEELTVQRNCEQMRDGQRLQRRVMKHMVLWFHYFYSFSLSLICIIILGKWLGLGMGIEVSSHC